MWSGLTAKSRHPCPTLGLAVRGSSSRAFALISHRDKELEQLRSLRGPRLRIQSVKV